MKDTADDNGITVLVVDDDALIAMSTSDMLEDLGHRVFEAHSGPQALKILDSGVPIDLLVTDFSMPMMTGAELARRAKERNPDIHVLLATGYGELPAGEGRDLPKLGKPYDQQQLAAEITKLIQVA